MENSHGAFFYPWPEALQAGVASAGGKGWNLGRLDRYGFKVPAGGVLGAGAYRSFLMENSLLADTAEITNNVRADNIGGREIEQKLSQLREKINAGQIPIEIRDELETSLKSAGILDKPVAVRSSATAEDSAQASFAGIHDSFLNVRGIDNILAAVKKCYASLWTPRAVAYRRKMNVEDGETGQAVVIMAIAAARASGVAFTCDPQTGREDVFVVNANFGLGESVVNGTVDPDTYYLDVSAFRAAPRLVTRKTGAKQGRTEAVAGGGTRFVPDHTLAAQPVLPDEKIKKLGLLLMRVFESLGECETHQDVEWAFDGEDFILLQARPVTALPVYTFAPLKNRSRIWSNGNYRDAVPMVLSPLHRRVMKKIIDTIQFTTIAGPGYPMPEGFSFSRLIHGRLYCDMSALQWAFYDSTGTLPENFNPFWGGHQPALEVTDTDPYKGEIGLERQRRAMRGGALIMESAANAAGIFAAVTRSVASLDGAGYCRTPDDAFREKYDELGQTIKTYCEQYCFLSGAGTLPLMLVLQKLSGYLGPRVMVVINGLMVGGEAGITSADHGYRLLELARLAREDRAAASYLSADDFDPRAWETALPESSPFKKAFREFIREYGYRAVYELDIINPRWEEDPSYPLDIIRGAMAAANPDQVKAWQKEKCDRAWQEVKEKVPSGELAEIRKGVREAQEGAALREMAKAVLVKALKAYRQMALELGERFTRRGLIQEPGDIFYCSWPDLFSILDGDWSGDGLQALVAARKASRREKESRTPPDVILGEKPVFAEPLALSSSDFLPGVAAAAGKASGAARLINHPGEGSRLQPGDVLVAPSTDPGWTPLFLTAGAVVMETGGYLSHGAIVAREYGVPCVVNVPGAMKVIKEGQVVVVDGDEGKVLI